MRIWAFAFILFSLIPQCVVSQTGDMLRYEGFLFVSQPVPDSIKAKMQGKSMPDNATIGYEELRYLTVFHYDYEGNIKKGELVCNKAIANDLLFIFRALFSKAYPITPCRMA